MTSPASLRSDLLAVQGLRHAYGPLVSIDDLSFTVAERAFVSIVGPSGCGKSTLLRCIAGLARPAAGRVLLDGRPAGTVAHGLAMVFQDYSRSLLPWKTVAGNVAFPLHGLDRRTRRQRVGDSLEAVGLAGFEQHYPWQLSGGMQQRTALARALAYRPRILLMDEPFASVDEELRAELEDLVLELRARFGVTVLFVTHSIDESVYLADRVLVLSRAPARLLADVAVDLPLPRDQIATREEPEFVRLRTRVARLVRAAPAGGDDVTTPAGRPR